jgi:hypothetical protein
MTCWVTESCSVLFLISFSMYCKIYEIFSPCSWLGFCSSQIKNDKTGFCTHQEHSTQNERSGSTSEFSIKLRHLLNIKYGELISVKRVKFVSHIDFLNWLKIQWLLICLILECIFLSLYCHISKEPGFSVRPCTFWGYAGQLPKNTK